MSPGPRAVPEGYATVTPYLITGWSDDREGLVRTYTLVPQPG